MNPREMPTSNMVEEEDGILTHYNGRIFHCLIFISNLNLSISPPP